MGTLDRHRKNLKFTGLESYGFRSAVRRHVSLHSVYPSVCRTDGYGTDRRLQEHALFRAKNVLYSFSSKTVRFECIVISALHVHLLSSKTP